MIEKSKFIERLPDMKQFLHRKRVWVFLLLPLSLLVSAIVSNFPDVAEIYATTVYPVIAKGINRITSIFPYSVMEMLLLYLVLHITVEIVHFIFLLIRKKEDVAKKAQQTLANLLCAAGVITFVFTLTCGLNYSRHTFAQTAGLEVRPSSVAELKALCTDLAKEANRLRAWVPTNDKSVTYLESHVLAAVTAQQTMDKMEPFYPTLRKGYGKPKPVYLSRVMSYLDITGVYFPFMVEANVNTDAPDYGIPHTMLHELSHLQGYMREDEANFIAYLACRKSDDILFQYSGTATAFVYANNALYAADPGAGQETYALLSVDVQRDFSDSSAYWKQFKGPIAELSTKINDTYLKSNRQEDGVKSYGQMVDLLLADYRKQKETGIPT